MSPASICGCVPITLSDAQAFMRGLHVATSVDTRPTGGCTKLIEDVLADSLFGVVAMPSEEFFETFISNQAANEIVDDQGKSVIAADSFVK